MKMGKVVLSLALATLVLVTPSVAQFTPLSGCSVTAPTPSEYSEIPVSDCLENTGTNIALDNSCAAPCISGNQCGSCARIEWNDATVTPPGYCLPLSFEARIGASLENVTLRCVPMKIAPSLANVFTSFTTTALGTVTPATFDASMLNGASGMTMNDFVCGIRDPTHQILSNTQITPILTGGALDGSVDFNAVSVLTLGDVDLGFSFQQVSLCLQETAAPSTAPTPQPTNSPNSPAATVTMSGASIALMLLFTLF